MATFSLRNDSASEILLADMGLPISASESLSFDTDQPFFDTICNSDDLRTEISSGDIVLVYDSSDLSVSDALDFLTIENKYLDESNDSAGGGWTVAATPPSSPSNGDGWLNTGDGILYTWDSAKSKWLSATRQVVTLSRSGSVDNSYLYGGVVTDSDISGVFLPRDATVTAVEIKAVSGNSNKGFSFEIDYTWLLDFYVVNHAYSNTALDYDLDKGEVFQIYAWGSGSAINNVIARVEFAWRYSA